MKGQTAVMDSTSLLVRRAQTGDREAFDALVQRFQARLENQIRSRMGSFVGSKMEVEDVLNATYACAYESIERFQWRGEETFYRWLGSIAEHLIRNASRKKSWAQLTLNREVPSPDPSPSKQLQRNARFDRLENALNSLSPDYKRAIVLSRIEGLKVSEISTKMNRSEGAVKKLLARALAELKESFGDTESFHLPQRRIQVEGNEDEN